MTKKKNLSFTKFFALLLSCLILVSAGSMVKVSADGTTQTDATAAITKEIQMPEGIDKPTGTVTFEFKQADAQRDPALSDVVLTLPGDATKEETAGGITTLTFEKALEEISTAAGKKFEGKSAGVYEYTVTEKQTGIDVTTVGKLEKHAIYSQASYKMQVQVANKTDAQGTPTGGTYIKVIKVTPLTKDDGTAINNGEKVEPKPSDDGKQGNDFKFINKYSTTVNNEGGKDPTTVPFSIEKIVAGEEGDVNQAFEFKFTIQKPALIAEETPSETFTYSIVPDTTANGAGVEAKTDVTGTYGQEITITLGHKDKLLVTKTYEGSKVTADESNAYGHEKAIAYKSSKNEEKTAITDEILLGQNNAAVVTNTKNTTTTVGFFLDNAPIILLIVVAVAAVVLFTFVNKKRKAQR